MTEIRKKRVLAALVILCAAIIAAVAIYLALSDTPAPPKPLPEAELALRQQFIATAEQWLGCNEADGSHKAIIDLYNNHTPLAQGYTVKYTDSWCATFVSAAAIQCGLTDIIPTECGCQRQIELFKAMGCWEEDDNYQPSPGDIIYYSTAGSKKSGDNTGWSDHVGIVVSVEGKTIKVIEGNYNDQVKYRTLKVGNKRIRGYGLPDFASATNASCAFNDPKFPGYLAGKFVVWGQFSLSGRKSSALGYTFFSRADRIRAQLRG